MAQAARKYDEAFDGEYVELPAAGAVVTGWGSAAVAADSPARRLHQRLIESFEAGPAVERAPEWRLSPRSRLLIVTGAVLLPWALAGVALAAY